MYRIAFALSAITLIGQPAVDGSPSVADGPPEAASTFEIHSSDNRWLEFIGEDLDRFVDAGLPQLVVDIHVWDHASASDRCFGHAGVFTVDNGVPRVDICAGPPEGTLGENLRHRLVLHELAHAWIHANVELQTRHEFMDIRRAKTWDDQKAIHTTRGTELAANVIMNTLHPNRPSRSGMMCGYELITGHPSPRGRTDPCRSGDPEESDEAIQGRIGT
jgi:hypothetical protein